MALFEGLRPATKPAKIIDQDLVAAIGAEPVAKKGKLSQAAFRYWVELGSERSYSAVAREFQCSVSAVSRYAARHSWEARLHSESPQRAEEVRQVVAVRMKSVPQLPALASESEQAREVRNQLLQVGMRLVATAEEYLAKTPLIETKDQLRALDIGSKLMLAAVESNDAKDGQSLIEMMKARLARLQADEKKPVKDADFTTKPVRGLDDDDA